MCGISSVTSGGRGNGARQCEVHARSGETFFSGPKIMLGPYSSRQRPRRKACCAAQQYDPNNRTAHYMLAQLLQQLGRNEEAKAEFAIAEKLQGQPGRP